MALNQEPHGSSFSPKNKMAQLAACCLREAPSRASITLGTSGKVTSRVPDKPSFSDPILLTADEARFAHTLSHPNVDVPQSKKSFLPESIGTPIPACSYPKCRALLGDAGFDHPSTSGRPHELYQTSKPSEISWVETCAMLEVPSTSERHADIRSTSTSEVSPRSSASDYVSSVGVGADLLTTPRPCIIFERDASGRRISGPRGSGGRPVPIANVQPIMKNPQAPLPSPPKPPSPPPAPPVAPPSVEKDPPKAESTSMESDSNEAEAEVDKTGGSGGGRGWEGG